MAAVGRLLREHQAAAAGWTAWDAAERVVQRIAAARALAEALDRFGALSAANAVEWDAWKAARLVELVAAAGYAPETRPTERLSPAREAAVELVRLGASLGRRIDGTGRRRFGWWLDGIRLDSDPLLAFAAALRSLERRRAEGVQL